LNFFFFPLSVCQDWLQISLRQFSKRSLTRKLFVPLKRCQTMGWRIRLIPGSCSFVFLCLTMNLRACWNCRMLTALGKTSTIKMLTRGPGSLLCTHSGLRGWPSNTFRKETASSFRQSGQNKIWQAGNVLICGILKDDADLVEAARNVILSELKLSPGEEGLQPDWSFHQHGAQFQSGNYGLSYAMSLSWWAKVLQGTGLDFPEEKIECLRSYVRNGLCPLVWKEWFDHNACARQVFPNAQSGKALCVWGQG